MSKFSPFKFLGPASEVPTDVTFLILGDEKSTADVKAHKHYLALASPVFKTLFYELDVGDVIRVKNTTVDAFNTMVNFIYKKFICFTLKTTEELYKLVQLAEQYQLPSLRDEVYGPWDSRPTDGIPYDVKFRVMEETMELEEENEESKVDEEVMIYAHKHHLALKSDVFAAQFYGGLPCNDIVTVRGTTFDALKTVIDHLYDRNENLEDKTMTQLFDILNQAEMYDLKELKTRVTNRILVFPLTEDTVMDVAFSVDNYKQFAVVEKVWKRCSDFLYNNVFKTMNEVSRFASDHEEDSRKGMIALRLLANPTVCPNCESIPCLDGTSLKPPYNAHMQHKKFKYIVYYGQKEYDEAIMLSSALEKDGTLRIISGNYGNVNRKPEKLAWSCKF